MAIVKKANNINIQVANNYTSLSKVSHEESGEVIIEATQQNLELSSQKRAILQGFGKESKKEEQNIFSSSKKNGGPIITITDQIVGSGQQKIVGNYTRGNLDYIYINVPLYQVTVIDDEDSNFKMEFMVTRDSWVVNKDNGKTMSLDNIAFEPAKGGSNEYDAQYIDVYPHYNNTSAFELRQNGDKILRSQPRKNDNGQDVTTASSVMIHVGGIYINDEERKTRHSGSLACFGIVNKDNSFKNPSDKEAIRVIEGIWKQADKDSYFGHANIKIIVIPRKNVEKTREVTKPASAL
ncbi:MAG: hypothetical protein MUW56_13165 [Chryseobacterium sp.]|uniref:hypothetical protein n=1 Tax=Chryseobacterium sp. TaxID=1871047 RepID=UPI0025C0ECD7|nr:hypothetical protein [Chryseobacterium sp.]MCJ7934544.1 hypothetical protein [Chryseobacterium sp.]